MSKQTYWEKLKDPRWQRKRLEIMQRDDFTCVSCGGKDKTLNVHHKTYRKNAEPWDYADENFVTYCEYCHEEIHQYFNEIKTSITDSHGAMILSCLALCNNDALEHMNSIRLVAENSLMTYDAELNARRIENVKQTVEILQQEIDKANSHNLKLSQSGIDYKDPFGALDAMIDSVEKRKE